MDKSNLELFKQAISEGLSEKLDSIVNNCTEEIVCSEKHKLTMRTIVYGKIDTKRTLPPKMKRIIAILIAAALLLTSCGIIFRNEIREIIENVYDFFTAVTYTETDSDGTLIEDVYALSYLPEGYYLEEEIIAPLCAQYKFKNNNGDYIWFEQKIIDGTDFVVDNESGYAHIKEIEIYDVYYKNMDKKHVYIWNDGTYSMSLISNKELSNEEIIPILHGMIIE